MTSNAKSLLSVLASLVLLAALAVPALAQTGSSGTVRIASGPHKGDYDFAPTETCFIAAFGDQPLGLSVVMQSQDSSLSLDVPNLDEKHAGEVHIVLVIAEMQAGKKSSVTYEIDTRPDSLLKPMQKAERASKGLQGKATTTLMQKGDSAMLSFTGETAAGVKLEGSVTCRKVV